MAVDSTDSCRQAVQCLLGKGPEYVVLTLGAKGAMFGRKEGDKSIFSEIGPDSDIVPEKVVDTTVSVFVY